MSSTSAGRPATTEAISALVAVPSDVKRLSVNFLHRKRYRIACETTFITSGSCNRVCPTCRAPSCQTGCTSVNRESIGASTPSADQSEWATSSLWASVLILRCLCKNDHRCCCRKLKEFRRDSMHTWRLWKVSEEHQGGKHHFMEFCAA